MIYIDIFLACHHAILNGVLIKRQTKEIKNITYKTGLVID